MLGLASHPYEGIVTSDNDPTHILRTPTVPLTEKDWDLAKQTAQKLFKVRETVLKGGAGLAAPQIGINHPIFIYTPDRATENLRVVVNPSFEPIGNTLVVGDEACFSVPLHCTKVKRWEKIKVHYQNLDGEVIEEVLEGFAAKAFQHEIDHIKGKLTIDHETADILKFSNAQAFQEHMRQVHVEDSKGYGQKK